MTVSFGAPRVVAVGLALTAASAVVGRLGAGLAHFWRTLVRLGVGWNLGLVGASAMVLECRRPAEKARVQSFHDGAVFGTMAIGSFLSGGLLCSVGCSTALSLPFLPILPDAVRPGDLSFCTQERIDRPIEEIGYPAGTTLRTSSSRTPTASATKATASR